MKVLYILISESHVGLHMGKDNKTEECHTIALTFPPVIEKKGSNFYFKNNLSGNRSFIEAVSLYFQEVKKRKVEFLVGFDIDIAGELMSIALKDNLVMAKIPEENIRRVPLTYDGYIAVRPFPELDEYCKYLFLQSLFSMRLKKAGIVKNVGFSKAFSLKHTVEQKGKDFIFSSSPGIDIKGVSTATVVTKSLTGEE